jgi:cytochrome c-type biogenesis protein CcmH/NrfG
MEKEIGESGSRSGWSTTQVYTMATICLALGLALGYLFRGSQTQSPQTKSQTALVQNQAAQAAPANPPQQMPTLDEMKHMADKQAEPLLAKLKSDPNNADTLKQVARTYESTHQFKEAAGYFGKALGVNPRDVATRTEMASCLYYSGNIDGALSQLQRALKDDPKDVNSLFNLGMIRWKGKNDSAGATEAWQQLLQSNPGLDPARRTQVQKLIAEAKQSSAH